MDLHLPLCFEAVTEAIIRILIEMKMSFNLELLREGIWPTRSWMGLAKNGSKMATSILASSRMVYSRAVACWRTQPRRVGFQATLRRAIWSIYSNTTMKASRSDMIRSCRHFTKERPTGSTMRSWWLAWNNSTCTSKEYCKTIQTQPSNLCSNANKMYSERYRTTFCANPTPYLPFCRMLRMIWNCSRNKRIAGRRMKSNDMWTASFLSSRKPGRRPMIKTILATVRISSALQEGCQTAFAKAKSSREQFLQITTSDYKTTVLEETSARLHRIRKRYSSKQHPQVLRPSTKRTHTKKVHS